MRKFLRSGLWRKRAAIASAICWLLATPRGADGVAAGAGPEGRGAASCPLLDPASDAPRHAPRAAAHMFRTITATSSYWFARLATVATLSCVSPPGKAPGRLPTGLIAPAADTTAPGRDASPGVKVPAAASTFPRGRTGRCVEPLRAGSSFLFQFFAGPVDLSPA